MMRWMPAAPKTPCVNIAVRSPVCENWSGEESRVQCIRQGMTYADCCPRQRQHMVPAYPTDRTPSIPAAKEPGKKNIYVIFTRRSKFFIDQRRLF